MKPITMKELQLLDEIAALKAQYRETPTRELKAEIKAKAQALHEEHARAAAKLQALVAGTE